MSDEDLYEDEPREDALVRKLRELVEFSDDPEYAHGEADRLLIEELRAIGYGGVAEAYDQITKWYA